MIPLPSKPKIIKKEENTTIFEIEGLYPGYGTTIGNSLRRVLLSSLEGAAVIGLKIEGVHHEFTTIDGILEDVISITLNIKKLRFIMHSDEPQKVSLNIKGEKIVTGSDLKVSSELELVNKDVHIATLTDKKSELKMELIVGKGIGYIIADQQKRDKLEVGQISIDSIFTPIKSMNFKVENMRVGKRTDFDRLSLKIETDGTIDPKKALEKALKILIDHFSSLSEEHEVLDESDSIKKESEIKGTEEIEKTEVGIEIKESKPSKEQSVDLNMKVEEMGISSRTANILIKNKIKTIKAITRKTEKNLMNLESMGDKGIQEIIKKLGEFGLKLKEL